MCVAIYQPSGERLTRKQAQALWAVNPDGGGIAYPHGGKVVIRKEMTFSAWWKTYQNARQKHPKAPMLLHMRIATHGEVGLDNTHPFYVGDDGDVAMIHNGVLWDCLPGKGDLRSDTRIFAEQVLSYLPKDWMENPYLARMVEEPIEDSGSKVAILTAHANDRPDVHLVGSFTKYDGMYFSNLYGLVSERPKYKWNTYSTPDKKADEMDNWLLDARMGKDDHDYAYWLEMADMLDEEDRETLGYPNTKYNSQDYLLGERW